MFHRLYNIVKDFRILKLDKIVNEVKATEEWEAVKMNLLEIGIQQGVQQTIISSVENAAANLKTDIKSACKIVGVSIEEYERAKEQLSK